MKKLIYFTGLSLALVTITSCAEHSDEKSKVAEEKSGHHNEMNMHHKKNGHHHEMNKHHSEMNGHQKATESNSQQPAGEADKGGA